MDPVWAPPLVSLAGLLLAWLTVRNNASTSRERDKDRFAHERDLQGEQFREARAERLRDTAFEKLGVIRRGARGVEPFLLASLDDRVPDDDDLSQLDRHQQMAAILRDATLRLKAALDEIDIAYAEAEWFHDRGWTPQIRENGEKLATAIYEYRFKVFREMALYNGGQTQPESARERHEEIRERRRVVDGLLDELANFLRES